MGSKSSGSGGRALALHRALRGKLSVVSKRKIRGPRDLALLYTPGVGEAAAAIAGKPAEVRALTGKGNTVAIVSDGSAVLGLGRVGPLAALPVMEGKAALFKEFAGLDAVPIVLATEDPDKIVAAVKTIAPGFGGVNLEDIAAPRCFAIEERLSRLLDVPVMHDDQHGTAIAVLAGLLNAFRVVQKSLPRARIVVSGAGAAGSAIAKILRRAGARDVILADRGGVLSRGRRDLPPWKRALLALTNPRNVSGKIGEALRGADALVGVSGPATISAADVSRMAPRAIVFALANPVPEIMPREARRGGAAVIATGRSDFPNQVNNALVFPGVFRGALDNRVRRITEEMKLRAAKKLAGLVARPSPRLIIPSVFDRRVVPAVASAVR